MAKEIRFVEDEIGERFEGIASLSDTVMIKYPGQRVSSKPLQSEDYANCNGVVLLGHNVAALSHHDLESGIPEEYLPRLIHEASAFVDIRDLTAVIIGGDSKHFERNKQILKDYGIPVIGQYLDSWNEGEPLAWQLPGSKITKADKHLVVIPNTREVLMYSRPVKYVRLTSSGARST